MGERIFDVVTAVQVAHAVVGSPAMTVKQSQLAPPTTPPAISRSVERDAAASAPSVSGEVGRRMEPTHEAKERAGGEKAPKDRTKTARDVGRTAVRGARNEQRARDLGRTATRGGR